MNAERALRDALRGYFGEAMIVEGATSRPWASATFSGTRHELKLILPGWAAPPADLGEREFDLKDHILIDVAVTKSAIRSGALRLTLEALTIVAD